MLSGQKRVEIRYQDVGYCRRRKWHPKRGKALYDVTTSFHRGGKGVKAYCEGVNTMHYTGF
jgi:hypothetical protein